METGRDTGAVETPLSEEIEEFELGPAMEALTKRQRQFVRAYVAAGKNGFLNNTQVARAAGYDGTAKSLKVQAGRLVHHPKIQAAIFEETRKKINLAAAMVATPVVIEIAFDKKAKRADRLRAAEMLFNRGGMPAMTEHKVSVQHSVDIGKNIELARRLALEIGVSAEVLIGVNRDAGKLIEGKVIEQEAEHAEAEPEPIARGPDSGAEADRG